MNPAYPMRNPWRHLGLVCAILSFILVVAACAPATQGTPAPALTTPAAPARTSPPPQPTPEQPRYGGILTISTVSDPEHFDVQQGSGINVVMPLAPAYSSLLYYDSETGSKIAPDLAESWNVSKDGLAYTLKLRKGIKFHDGTLLSADDVAFNLQRMKSPPKGVVSQVGPYMVAVDKVQAIGDDTVAVTMKNPFAPFLAALVLDRSPMYSQKTVLVTGDMKTTVMGTGPFKLKAYTPSVSFELIKNADYWVKGRPYLDGIRFAIIKDPTTRLAALRTGQTQQSGRVFGALTPAEVATLKGDVPDMRFVPSPSVVGPWFFMNMRNPLFKDARVRQAINLALDRQAAIKVVAQGAGSLGTYFPFPGWGTSTEELLKLPGFRQPHDQDIATAKKLLGDAGYPNGFSLKILSRNNEVTKAGAVFMTDQLSTIGITASVQVMEDGAFFDSGRKALHEAMVFTPATVIADPYDMGRFFAPRNPFNFSGNDDDAKLSDLWEKQVRTIDEAARKQIILDVERYLLNEQVPAVPIVWPTTYIAISSHEHGFVPGLTDYSNNRQQDTWLSP